MLKPKTQLIMKFLCYIDRVNLMNRLIQKRATGTPEDFAGILGVSRTRLYEMLEEIKSYNAPIAYDKTAKTFFYEHPFDISISFSVTPLEELEANQYNGGSFFQSTCFPDFTHLTLQPVSLQTAEKPGRINKG